MMKIEKRMGRRPKENPEERLVPRNFTLAPEHVELLTQRAAARRTTASQILREILDRELTEGA